MCIIRERSWLETVIGKKLILFREKHTPKTEGGPSQKVSVALKCGVVSFYGMDNFIG